jgi:hypothetical protein
MTSQHKSLKDGTPHVGQLGALAYDLTGDQIARDHALRDLRNPPISSSSDGPPTSRTALLVSRRLSDPAGPVLSRRDSCL